jgi:hypothetical protein
LGQVSHRISITAAAAAAVVLFDKFLLLMQLLPLVTCSCTVQQASPLFFNQQTIQ